MTSMMTSCTRFSGTTAETQARLEQSPQYSAEQGKFVNWQPVNQLSLSKIWDGMKEMLFNRDKESVPVNPVPVRTLDLAPFADDAPTGLRYARLGHSTLLIRLGDKNWLTDPVFSERASPVQWMGPKRFHPVPLNLDQLPAIEGVIISHNHYDHLDYGSIQLLKDRVGHFVVPLGIADKLVNWGVARHKITELDWWQQTRIAGIELIATPTQHFSGRGAFDSDKTLWASWIIRDEQHSIYFSGDSGYFPGFRQIGDKYGPFDLAFMECGAYNPQWADVHMMPEETLQAFKDVQGKVLVPIHNGTFDLSTHAWFDPMQQISALAQQHKIDLQLPVIGDVINYPASASDNNADNRSDWWH